MGVSREVVEMSEVRAVVVVGLVVEEAMAEEMGSLILTMVNSLSGADERDSRARRTLVARCPSVLAGDIARGILSVCWAKTSSWGFMSAPCDGFECAAAVVLTSVSRARRGCCLFVDVITKSSQGWGDREITPTLISLLESP